MVAPLLSMNVGVSPFPTKLVVLGLLDFYFGGEVLSNV